MKINTQYKQINYGTIIDSSQEVYCVFDIEKNIISFNNEWKKLTGIDLSVTDSASFLSILFSDKDIKNFTRHFDKAVSENVITKSEFRIRHGKMAFHTISYSLIYDGKSTVFLSGRVATSDKRLSRLRALIAEHTTLGAWKYDLTDSSLTWTIGTYAILEADGTTKITPETLLDICHPDFLEVLSEKYYKLIEHGEEFDIEVILLKMRSGSEMWAKISGYAYFDEAGKIERVYGIVQDIDKYKRAEINITSEKQKAQIYLDIARVIIVVLKPDQTVELINKAGCEILEYDEEEIIGRNWFDTVVPDSMADILKESYNNFISGDRHNDHSAFENPIKTKTGKIRYISWKNSILRDKEGNIIASISSGEDITEKKIAEKNLKIEQERYQLALQGVAAGVWDFFNFREEKLYVSPKYLELVGRKYEERVYTLAELESWIDPDYLKIVQDAFYKYLEEKTDSYSVEGKFIMGDGSSRWFLFSGKAIWDEDGSPIRAVGSIIDIDDRKKAEEKLKQQDTMLRAVINNGLMHSILVDKDGVIIMCDEPVNSRAEEFYESVIRPGMHLSKFVQPGDYPLFQSKIDEALTNGPHKMEYSFTISGVEYWYLLNFAPVGKTETSLADKVLINTLEITQNKKAEQDVIKAKQLAEEVSRLKSNFLANMSHEIRTPLNGMIGLSNLLEKETDLKKIRELVGLQKQSNNRLLETLTSILNFARLESEFERMPLNRVNVGEVITSAYNSLKDTAEAKHLKINLAIKDENVFCLADEGLFYQVFHNLIHNAIKFTNHGNIEVEIGKKEKYVYINVSDTGIGISEDFADKIFFPFLQESQGESRNYQGNGLGLSIAKRYIELLRGSIKVSSLKGKGSSFEVLLPAVT
jgi:PAS domain S-box-containing protein